MNSLKTTRQFVMTALIGVALTMPFQSTDADEPWPGAVYQPSMELDKANGSIKVDGHLNETAWESASHSDSFVERYPGNMAEPEVRTEVYVTYDNSHIYIGFIAYDQPDDIRATMCQRDQFSGDDYVAVMLDTYGNAAWTYEFHVNPFGVQRDRLLTYVGSTMHQDFGYDLIWESAAKVSSEGWSAEIAIPFSSIRFPGDETQTWKVNFERFHPREINRVYSWTALDRDEQCGPCQWGTVSGMSDIQPGKGFEVLPAMVGQQMGYRSDGDFSNEDADGEMALSGKYSISSDVTLEAALNPDYSQIEADAAQVDVNSAVALLYPERRPFFQEGSDIFSTLFNSFNTRNILDPQLAVKLTGRSNDYRYGLLSAIDETTPYIVPTAEGSLLGTLKKSYVNVFRAARTIGSGVSSHNVGILVGDRRYEGGGSNTIGSLDMTIRLSRNYSIDGQYILTHTEEPEVASDAFDGYTFENGKHTTDLDGETYSGFAMISRFMRRSNNWNFTLDFNQVGPAYQTQVGWDPWNDYRNGSVSSWYNLFVRKGILEILTPQVYFGRRWNYDGQQKFENINLGLNANLNWAQTNISVNYRQDSERWYGVDFDDLKGFGINLNSRPVSSFAYHLSANFSEAASVTTILKGDEVRLQGSLTIQPIDRIIVSPSYTYVNADDVDSDLNLYQQNIFRTRLQYQFTRSLSLRLVVQHNDASQTYAVGPDYLTYSAESWEVDPLITYRISPFSVFFIGSTYDIAGVEETGRAHRWELNERHYFMKLQYLFQI